MLSLVAAIACGVSTILSGLFYRPVLSLPRQSEELCLKDLSVPGSNDMTHLMEQDAAKCLSRECSMKANLTSATKALPIR